VLKRGGKGRISNELAAASCAAIIAVYAAGTWRTRDADRRFGAESEMRRPARPALAPATSVPAAVAAVIAQAAPAAPPAASEPRVTNSSAIEPTTAPKKPVKVAAAPTPDALAAPQSSVAASATAAATVVEATPEPAPGTAVAGDEAAAESSRKRWLDGYYTGWGTSRHGDIQSFVRIEDGKIIDAGVASCETRYPCDVIDRIIRQPIERQSADVDRVSRATESADAYYYGLVTALEHAESGTFKSVRP
jgi:uncharacterized protein with FMN-binding domain